MEDASSSPSSTSAASNHEFASLNTLLLVLVLGLCILSAYLVKIYKFYYLPESAAAILVGLIVGGMARLLYPSKDELDFLSFQPEIFFFLFLPPIIFEAGYTLRKKQFFSNFWTITMYAVLGTLVSTFIVGFLTFWLGKMGAIPIDSENPMEALIFGSLISAVDPVATLSIIGSPELNCDPLLYSLVFGESVLNDAVSIVLFRTFSQYYSDEVPFSPATLPVAISNFVFVSLGSIFAGFAMALACCYICKHTQLRDYPKYEISLLFLFAYGAYAFAEAIALSGVMALFFCGVILSHYNSYNLSKPSAIASEHIFKSLAVMAEFFVFLYMGMGFFTGRFRRWNGIFILFAIFFCLLARFFNIFPISFLANLGRRQKIPFKMQVVIWFSGLRGAIAFALAQNMPGPRRDLYTTTTLCICICSTLVCGGLTEPILEKMNMKVKSSELEVPIAEQGLVDSNDRDLNRAQRRRSRASDGGMHSMWKHFDNHWMKPVFGGSSEEALFYANGDEEDDEIQELMADRRNGIRSISSTGSGGSVDGLAMDVIERGVPATAARGVITAERRGSGGQQEAGRRGPSLVVPVPNSTSRVASKYTPPLRGGGGGGGEEAGL